MELEKLHSNQVFDFIQQSLRIVALEYGASLVYVSTLRPDTIHQLQEYVMDTLFQTRITRKPQVLERDVIFIPFGWDSVGKIKMTQDTFPCDQYLDDQTISPFLEQDYQSVISKKQDIVLKDVLIVPENEQEFLERQASILKNLDPAVPVVETKKIPEHKSPSKDKSDYQAKIARLLEQSNSIREKKQGVEGEKPVGANNEVLNSFFQSLLTKKQGSSPKQRRKSSANQSSGSSEKQ
jgi:hypothetical protein